MVVGEGEVEEEIVTAVVGDDKVDQRSPTHYPTWVVAKTSLPEADVEWFLNRRNFSSGLMYEIVGLKGICAL